MWRHVHRIALVGCIGLGAARPVGAQDDTRPLVADRPTQGASAIVIRPGFVQFEGGVTLAGDRSRGVRRTTVAVPQGALRVGLAPNIEARVEIEGWMWESISAGGTTVNRNGFGDLTLGAKWSLVEEDDGRPGVAIMGRATIPTGAPEFRGERVDPEFRVMVDRSITSRAAVGVNAILGITGIDDGSGDIATQTDFGYSAATTYRVSDRVAGFLELFGSAPLTGGRSHAASLDGGFTFLRAATVQLDIVGGVGLTSAAQDWFAGAGVTVRVPE